MTKLMDNIKSNQNKSKQECLVDQSKLRTTEKETIKKIKKRWIDYEEDQPSQKKRDLKEKRRVVDQDLVLKGKRIIRIKKIFFF